MSWLHTIIGGVCWLVGLVVALGLCRAAAIADEAMDDVCEDTDG